MQYGPPHDPLNLGISEAAKSDEPNQSAVYVQSTFLMLTEVSSGSKEIKWFSIDAKQL
jgi:hypothetical protein